MSDKSKSTIETDTTSLSQCSTKVDSNSTQTATSSKPDSKKPKTSRNPFKSKKEPLPEWKIEQQRRFKEWEKASYRNTSSASAFTDFYRPSKNNKAFWIWWL